MIYYALGQLIAYTPIITFAIFCRFDMFLASVLAIINFIIVLVGVGLYCYFS
jgi:hypothetical protein